MDSTSFFAEHFFATHDVPLDYGFTGNVYVVQLETGEVKIGQAKDLYRRMANIRCDNPCGVALVACRELPYDIARTLEKWLHRQLKAYSIRGEWYRKEVLETEIVRRLFGETDGDVENST